MKQQLAIQGQATGSTKVVLKAKPVVPKPKYQAPPPKQQTKKQTKPPAQQIKQQPQPPQQKEKKEVKVVQLKESFVSDVSEPDNPQFTLKQEPIIQQEVAQIHTPVKGEVMVRYSHYKEKFPIIDGQLQSFLIDEKYCLSFVFKGDYKLILKTEDKQTTLQNIKGGWDGCEDGKVYWLEIDEDPVQEEWDRQHHKAYEAPKDNSCPLKNKKVELISSELKGMSIQEINEKGDKYKELIEARDLEDILFK